MSESKVKMNSSAQQSHTRRPRKGVSVWKSSSFSSAIVLLLAVKLISVESSIPEVAHSTSYPQLQHVVHLINRLDGSPKLPPKPQPPTSMVKERDRSTRSTPKPLTFSRELPTNPTSMVKERDRSTRSTPKPLAFSRELPTNPTYVRESTARDLDLNCKARGDPKPKVTWYKDGAKVADKRRRFEDYKIRRWGLHITNARVDDNGNYTCVVENSAGVISRDFIVEIVNVIQSGKPVIVDGQPGNHTVERGQDLELRCDLAVYDPVEPSIFTWYFHKDAENVTTDPKTGKPKLNLVRLQNCGSSGVCFMQSLNETYTVGDARAYTIYNISERDIGPYTCSVRNSFGVSLSTAYVTFDIPIDTIGPIEDEDDRNATVLTAQLTLSPLNISLFVAGFLVFVLAIAVFCCFHRKTRRRERKKMDAAMKKADDAYLWTRVVVTTLQDLDRPAQLLIAPDVSIEKKSKVIDREEQMETDYVFEAPDELWEFDRDLLTPTDETLGEGEFGRVFKATTKANLPGIHTVLKEGSVTNVAVKTLKDGHTDEDMVDMVKEMEIMKAVGAHEHVINLLGVCKQPMGKPLYLIIEYAEKGDLLTYLRAQRAASKPPSPYEVPLSTLERSTSFRGGLEFSEMMRMGREVAAGMEFLAGKKFVHRDLAARNIFLSRELSCKIGDFGMTRDIQSTDYYRKLSAGKVPIKWMSPEAIAERKFSTKSDVWSFGVVLWEIVTLGEPPHRNVDAGSFMNEIRLGVTLDRPRDNCPDDLWNVMRGCWALRPEERPGWDQLRVQLRFLRHGIAQNHGYLELTGNSEMMPYLPGRTTTNSSTSSGISSNCSATPPISPISQPLLLLANTHPHAPSSNNHVQNRQFSRLNSCHSCHSPSSPSVTSPSAMYANNNVIFNFDPRDTADYVNEQRDMMTELAPKVPKRARGSSLELEPLMVGGKLH